MTSEEKTDRDSNPMPSPESAADTVRATVVLVIVAALACLAAYLGGVEINYPFE